MRVGQLKYILAGAAGALLLAYLVVYAGADRRDNQSENVYTGSRRSVCVYEDGGYALMDVEDYAASTLKGMMSDEWTDEMLRVMAVVIRTGIYHQMDADAGEGSAYGTGSAGSRRLINESELSEIRYSDAELMKLWGDEFDDISQRADRAVDATEGEVVLYDGEVIIPACHMVSIGQTVSAEELCGYDIPYLRQVSSDADRLADEFTTTFIYSEDRLRKSFSTGQADADGEAADSEVSVTAATVSGFAQTVNVFGTDVPAEDFCRQLNLVTTNIHIDRLDEGYRIITVGVGNSLGLSIYGASVLAENGESYDEILEYYYQGTTVEIP